MRRIRRLSKTLVSRPCPLAPASRYYASDSSLAMAPNLHGEHEEDGFLDAEEAYDPNQCFVHDDALFLHKPRYDWKTRASSRRRPGGLIDSPITNEKVVYPRRNKYPVVPLSLGEPWYAEIQNYKHRFVTFCSLYILPLTSAADF